MTRWITCREFVDFLDAYLARRLQPAHQEEFNDHLSGCPPCVAYMHSYQDSIRLGKATLMRSDTPVPETVPEALVQAILAAQRKAGA